MNFHAYLAKCVQNPKNVYYPDRVSISCQADLEKAVRMDHVAAQFEGGIRGLKNFRSADVSIMDCDNDSDDPKDWVHPEDLYYLFPGVAFAVVASRSDGKAKGNKSAVSLVFSPSGISDTGKRGTAETSHSRKVSLF